MARLPHFALEDDKSTNALDFRPNYHREEFDPAPKGLSAPVFATDSPPEPSSPSAPPSSSSADQGSASTPPNPSELLTPQSPSPAPPAPTAPVEKAPPLTMVDNEIDPNAPKLRAPEEIVTPEIPSTHPF